MTVQFKLPDIGEGVAEANLVRWLVQEGERVDVDQPLAEVQTDKAVVQLPSPAAGRVNNLPWQEGATVPVGEVLVVIAATEEEPLIEQTLSPPPSPRRGEKDSQERRVLAAPSTRRLARELGVALTHLEGSGPQGRVMDEDVRRVAACAETMEAKANSNKPGTNEGGSLTHPTASSSASDKPASEDYTEELLSPIRRVIAERLTFSLSHKPHATHFDTLDVSALVGWRQRIRAAGEKNIGYLSVLIKIIAISLRDHPRLNAHYDEDRRVVQKFQPVHIGVAADTPQGLLVPVLHHVEEKNICQLADELKQKTEVARQGKLIPTEMSGSTFSVSNTGPLGGQRATPIINPPEVAILVIHPIEQRPVVKEGKLDIGWRMNVSLSFDHRVLDGGDAIRFTQTLESYTTCMDKLLLELK
ncbi:dihydrolipoamide acetyltransferase family protein [Desmospora activa]|uniref:Dihydrolipoamide acetyltransferase component of pyruvate dehydrogenase complex n=1 Tax=Desmospora activa DSM 45169 TaxID=1121389 RepID=A0A2T4ZD60_9BACL|nr:dihydrolipoamide acetyltransferase family protein [Desmospora activa]PTM59820.1 pyruvate dehydrogenase E2 component (dihydrolipoamide acetyltransferase) [Desmospora activa DSM 45169]